MARVVFERADATRVLVLQHVQDDTYVIIDDGEVSLSNSETLKLLLQQLIGR
jgi:hypothetical protein